MKIVCAEKTGMGYDICVKPDTAVCNNEQPFYIPEFDNKFEIEIGYLVKINKMGKYIGEKYVENYYDEVALAMNFVAVGTRDKLMGEGKALDISYSFDNSVVVGDFFDKKMLEEGSGYEIFEGDRSVKKGEIAIGMLDEVICYSSQYFTYRKGDLVFLKEKTREMIQKDWRIRGKMGEECRIGIDVK